MQSARGGGGGSNVQGDLEADFDLSGVSTTLEWVVPHECGTYKTVTARFWPWLSY
jgi:hypothetical protein